MHAVHTGCTNGTINTTSFDTWGIWSDGDGLPAQHGRRRQCLHAVLLRAVADNTGTSTTTTSNLALASYSELTVTFYFKTLAFATGEDFWLQFRPTAAPHTAPGPRMRGYQLRQWQFLFCHRNHPRAVHQHDPPAVRCDASTDNDLLFIDNVTITGCNSAGMAVQGGSE